MSLGDKRLNAIVQKVRSFLKETSLHNKRISSIVVINLLLALVSLCKDILLAGYLGTSAHADSFLLAYFIIDTIGNNLIASSLGVAVIPVLAGLYESGEDQRLSKLIRLIIFYTVIISTIIAAAVFGMRFNLLAWIGAGLDESSRQLSLELFNLLIPMLVVFPLTYIGISIMQVHNRFYIPALAPVLFNAVYLIGLSYLLYFKIPLARGVYSITFVIMIGIVAMVSLVWFPALKNRLIALPSWNSTYKILFEDKFTGVAKRRLLFWSSDLQSVWKCFLPYLLTILFPQIIFLVERYLASHLGTGSISGLNYAFRLVQFPIWVFIAAVSAVLFPAMAKLSATGDKDGMKKILEKSIYITAVFTIPLSIILFVLRVPIISILLQRGEFNSHSVYITANIMIGYTLAIVFQGFTYIWIRVALVEAKVFYALCSAAVSALITISADFILVPLVGASGLGYGTTIGSIINFTLLYLLLSRYRHLHFSNWRGLIKIVLANLPLVLITFVFLQLWVCFENEAFIFKLGYAVIVIVVCLPIYWLGLRLFRVIL